MPPLENLATMLQLKKLSSIAQDGYHEHLSIRTFNKF